MDGLFDLIDDIPVPTIMAVGAAIGAIIALANGSIDFEQFLLGIGVAGGGSGALAFGRAQAKQPRRGARRR